MKATELKQGDICKDCQQPFEPTGPNSIWGHTVRGCGKMIKDRKKLKVQ